MTVAETKIYPINTGWVTLNHATYLYLKGDPDKWVDIPNTCYYVDTGEHKIMVDTGLPDAERASAYHRSCEKRGCPESPDGLRALGVEPEEIDICIFTHLHWDHCHNMKAFTNARYIVSRTELQMAYNPMPIYYRSYESPALGIEPPFYGCQFEMVAGETEIVPGVTMFDTPGHSVGHMSVTVETSAGDIVIVGDAMLRLGNIEPNHKEKWRYWIPQRNVSLWDAWHSIGEIDKRADYLLLYHDEANLEHDVYPYEGMPLRTRREPIDGLSFYFSGI